MCLLSVAIAATFAMLQESRHPQSFSQEKLVFDPSTLGGCTLSHFERGLRRPVRVAEQLVRALRRFRDELLALLGRVAKQLEGAVLLLGRRSLRLPKRLLGLIGGLLRTLELLRHGLLLLLEPLNLFLEFALLAKVQEEGLLKLSLHVRLIALKALQLALQVAHLAGSVRGHAVGVGDDIVRRIGDRLGLGLRLRINVVLLALALKALQL